MSDHEHKTGSDYHKPGARWCFHCECGNAYIRDGYDYWYQRPCPDVPKIIVIPDDGGADGTEQN